AEELCQRAITALDRPDTNPKGTASAATGGGGAAGKGSAGGAKGKGGAKKGDAAAAAASGGGGSSGGGGAAGARRANVSELKGLVEVCAACQTKRAGASAVTGEGRPLLQALALLTAASALSGAGPPAEELVEKCTAVMREYRGTIAAAEAEEREKQHRREMRNKRDGPNADVTETYEGTTEKGDGGPANAKKATTREVTSVALAHGGGAPPVEKVDVFAALSGRRVTNLEEDRAELELAGEIWCRLGKERLARGQRRAAEECCGYVTELLPQRPADRRRVHPRLWRWLAVGEGLWGQAVASAIAPESQEKPLQDELRRVSMKHLALAAKFATLASSSPVTLDVAKRLWNVALPLADTSAGRAIAFSALTAVLREMAKAGIIEGGAVRARLYVLLFECYSDRSEWKQGLAAVTDSLRCVPPDFQRPLWQWRVVFLSRLGITSLDGLAKTKESDKVLQGKSWCTLARSASDPKQQLSAYLKALESFGERFDKLDCLVEMGEWAMGRGLAQSGSDCLWSALDLLYDVEERSMQALNDGPQDTDDDSHDGVRGKEGRSTCESNDDSRAQPSTGGGLRRAASKRSLGSQGGAGSRGSSRGGAPSSKGGASSSTALSDQNGYPEALTMGHLETAVRTLAMLARGGGCCSTFEERLDVLMQGYYFVGRMAGMVEDTVECGRRRWLFEESVPEGGERGETAFQEWCASSSAAEAAAESSGGRRTSTTAGGRAPLHLRDWAYWRLESVPVEPKDDNGGDKNNHDSVDDNGEDNLCRYMAAPPTGREPFVISTTTIEKAPLLFHHLLDLAETMESHGLAAHAAAPLALAELVARLCLGPARRRGGGGSAGDGVDGKGVEDIDEDGSATVFPALALARLRRARLLFKLGPTCHEAAVRAASAAGPLGVSAEEAARRGSEVDRILRQRKEDSLQQPWQKQEQQPGMPGKNVSAVSSLPPAPSTRTRSDGSTLNNTTSGLDPPPTAEGMGRKSHAVADDSGGREVEVPRLENLEDRKIWAMLATEAVQLGECRAAAEYLAAAQRHNDAFHDRNNVVSCLEAQAALCDAQGHPDRALPCLLRASALLKTRDVTGSIAVRWGKMAIAIGGMMRKMGTGDAKIRQTLQTACDALERSIFRGVHKAENSASAPAAAEGGQAAQPQGGVPPTLPQSVDLDAAIAFSGCVCLLAEASTATDESTHSSSSEVGKATKANERGTSRTGIAMTAYPSATATSAAVEDFVSSRCTQQQGQKTATPRAVRILCDAADKLRPLGNHPALPAVLRHTAREWVRCWAKSPAAAGAAGAGAGATTVVSSSSASSSTARNNRSHDHGSPQRPKVSCLEEAAKCLAEAREVLSALAAEAEPTRDALSSLPPLVAAETPPANTEDGEEPAGAKKGKGAADSKGGKKAAEGKSKNGAAASSPPADSADVTPTDESTAPAVAGSVSTPLGRCLAMVQLEEACVRVMLGRAKGDGHSSTKAAEAAANREGVTPVQKYMEASRPLGHPTMEEMALPQIEQALALAEMARERCSLSSSLGGTSGVTTNPGLLPLTLAWEGSALALLASRAGLSDGAWVPRPPPPRPPTPPVQAEPIPAKGGKGAGKGGKEAKSGKGGTTAAAAAAAAAQAQEGKEPASVPPMQEGFDLREQARWKLEQAMEAAVAAKRWDAASVAAFALAEMVGGDDASAAAAALMLHQSCRARGRMLRLLRGALPLSNRYRLFMDRVSAAQGLLRGLHNLDTCDPFLVPSPSETGASAGGTAGEGTSSSTSDFPPAEASEQMLSTYLEGWRRLECAGESTRWTSSLWGLPEGLGVLSLQVSPDGTTLYAAGYAPVPSLAVEPASGTEAGTSSAAGDGAVIWRHEMKPTEVRKLAMLRSRMEAFGGSVKRCCLEKCDEEGKKGDYVDAETDTNDDHRHYHNSKHGTTNSSNTELSKADVEKTVAPSTVPSSSSAATVALPPRRLTGADCESELELIIAETEAALSPLWAEDVEGGLAPFLDRCRAEKLSLVLLMDQKLEKLPVEACAAVGGISSVSRDFSLHMLRHRLKATTNAATPGHDVVSNAHMRYVADPLSEDPGVSAPTPPPVEAAKVSTPNRAATSKGKNGGGGKQQNATEGQAEEGGRLPILKVLRKCVGQDGDGGGKEKGTSGGSVKVSAWKGVGGDDHIPGVREWQSLISGNGSAGEGGFVYYGPGRCLSKLPPKHLVGLSASCKAAILIDRADTSVSRRLESKQDTLKSPEELEAEEPAQTAALFSLVGCQSVVLNMWSVTLHNNRRVICSLFRGWGEEGLALGNALATVRGDVCIKPRARFCTVLYGLPTLKYGP
ncbi:unnamed protein product, partial [Ectocarpus sp. 4 AP-2014]